MKNLRTFLTGGNSYTHTMYAVRQVGTDLYMPTKSGRRATALNFKPLKDQAPRLFTEEHHADAAIREWKEGIQDRKASGPGVYSTTTDPVASRASIKLEVVPVRIKFPT